jgi:predicted RNA-binding protein with PUA-like domain
MAIWLLKTEPSVYSYDDLERDGETMWDGVTNNAALQNIRKMEAGDLAIIITPATSVRPSAWRT